VSNVRARPISWLPFYATMRIYQPKPEVISGAWKAPPLQKVN
jgi:hypothetical protein